MLVIPLLKTHPSYLVSEFDIVIVELPPLPKDGSAKGIMVSLVLLLSMLVYIFQSWCTVYKQTLS